MPASKPLRLRIRTYQVGFGDCFLLSFEYAAADADAAEKRKRDRHVLIDFGSTKSPPDAPPGLMLRVAKQIAEDCGGKLSAVVATHRHKDHISGFAGNAKRNGPGDIVRGLGPDAVIQPWTEDPSAPPDARAPRAVRAVKRSLRDMSRFAAAAVGSLRHLRRDASAADAEQIAFIGDDNIANRKAIENLIRMGRRRGAKAHYVKAGDRTRLDRLLPGVKVHVLGPPTAAAWEKIQSQRSKDPAEFWHLNARAAAVTPERPPPLFARRATLRNPIHARWFRKQLRAIRAETSLAIVRMLDDAMNNTSLILLFEVGGACILFPGDAQLENWQYALSSKRARALLKRVTVYKVGHHGSLNATPKSLWKLFANKGKARMTSLLSTLEDVHGERKRKTEVPRRTLVTELRAKSRLVSTQDFRAGVLRRETVIAFR